MTQKVLGEINRRGPWRVVDEEFWAFISDMKLDMIEADFPYGMTKLRIISFVGDIKITIPADVGVSVTSTAFVSDVKLPDYKETSIFAPVEWRTDNYKLAESKIEIEATCFVGDIKVRQA